nr:MAG TPA: hypothetical protein [Caudoviricetes sp.]
MRSGLPWPGGLPFIGNALVGCLFISVGEAARLRSGGGKFSPSGF